MSELSPDDRLISGAVISAEIWFALDAVSAAVTFGRDEVLEPGCVSFRYGVRPLRHLTLEGEVKSLSDLTGILCVSSQRERTERLGSFRRQSAGYSVEINLLEAELDRFIGLLASGLIPRTLKVEFDIEVAQWFDMSDYWDDVRYPIVDLHEYHIEWAQSEKTNR